MTKLPPITTMRTLAFVEDDEIMQCLFQKYFNAQNYNSICLFDGQDLPALLGANRVDLIVLDVMLPTKSGLYWLKWLRQYHSHIPIIIASAKISEEDRLIGLENGARDYIVKPFQLKELLIRIENILKVSQVNSHSKFIQMGALKLDTEKGIIYKGNSEIRLTQLEMDILKLLYINSGAAISRDDIMGQIRGTIHNPFDRSIDIHINKLRKKIEDNPAEPVYIRTVRGKGYRLYLEE
jgi:DNA-binding response OmpR family regulator